MKAVRPGALTAFLLCWVPAAPAQTDLPPAAREVLGQFEKVTAEISRQAEADLKVRRGKITAELKKLQDLFCKEAKLDEAVAVRDLIRSLNAGTVAAPAGELPPAAREICKQYEQEATEIARKAEVEVKKRWQKTAAELKKLQDRYCKEAKLDEAVAVRDLIRSARDGVANVLPDPGYVNNGAEDIGKVLYYEVTGTTTQSIWGTDVYTTGSHLGLAAVHCGLLKPEQKGVVKVTILPGQATYAASTRRGVTSYPYGQWHVSFKVERSYWFAGLPPVPAPPRAD